MKIVPDNQPQDNKVITAEQRHVKEKKHVAAIKPHPGHRIWEFDLATGEITEAAVDTVEVVMSKPVPIPEGHRRIMGETSNTVHKKITHRPNCLYCSALNKKNALKHFIPMYEELVASGKLNRPADDQREQTE